MFQKSSILACFVNLFFKNFFHPNLEWMVTRQRKRFRRFFSTFIYFNINYFIDENVFVPHVIPNPFERSLYRSTYNPRRHSAYATVPGIK